MMIQIVLDFFRNNFLKIKFYTKLKKKSRHFLKTKKNTLPPPKKYATAPVKKALLSDRKCFFSEDFYMDYKRIKLYMCLYDSASVEEFMKFHD